MITAAGVALRLWLVVCYRPAFLGYPDARTYLIAARGPLFWNPYRPAGYPLLLRLLRRLDRRLTATIVFQHGLGVTTAMLLYAACRPHVSRSGAACVPAAVVLGSGSQLFLEHSVLSDGPYAFLVAGALYCGSRSIASSRAEPWLALSGVALGLSATQRSPGIVGVPLMSIWAAVGARRRRISGVTAVVGGAGLALLPYLLVQRSRTGTCGLTRTTGFTLYARVAPFADCARFTPPRGTEALCEQTPPAQRPNATWYMFGWPDAPALRAYGVPPYPLHHADHSAYRWRGENPTLRFALKVITSQPLDFLRSTAQSLMNFVRPNTGPPSAIGLDHRRLIDELHNPYWELESIPHTTSYYSTGPGYVRRGVKALDGYARAARLEGIPTAVLTGLALIGWASAGGGTRRAAALFAGAGVWGAALTAALLFYDARYATPLYGPLAAAAAIGVDRLLDCAS